MTFHFSTPNHQMQIIEVTPATATLIPPLVSRVYGSSHTDTILYDPAAIAWCITSGERKLFLGLDSSGNAQGMLALSYSLPSRAVAEVGLLLVDPALSAEASGWLLCGLMQAVIIKSRQMARENGLRCLISLEVTSHKLSQRLAQQARFTATGIYLGITPCGTEQPRFMPNDRSRCASASRQPEDRIRRSETLSVRPFPSMIVPCTVALPHRFETVLVTLYQALKIPILTVPAALPSNNTIASESFSQRRNKALIEVTHVGSDAPDVLLNRLRHYCEQAVELIHVMLPISHVNLDPTVEALLAAEFQYAGLIPMFREHDVLVLQYLNGVKTDVSEDDLESPLAKMLLRNIIRPLQSPHGLSNAAETLRAP